MLLKLAYSVFTLLTILMDTIGKHAPGHILFIMISIIYRILLIFFILTFFFFIAILQILRTGTHILMALLITVHTIHTVSE